GPGRLAIEQESCLDIAEESTAIDQEDLAERLGVGGSTVELEPLVGIVVDANGQDVESSRGLGRGGSGGGLPDDLDRIGQPFADTAVGLDDQLMGAWRDLDRPGLACLACDGFPERLEAVGDGTTVEEDAQGGNGV